MMRRLVLLGLIFLLIGMVGASGVWAVPEASEVTVPEGCGKVKQAYKGRDDRLVVLLQDLHNHYEAQFNNAKILESLMDAYGVSLVAVEGAAGLVDLGFYRSLPDPVSTERAAHYFLKQGDYRGEEYLAMTRKEPFTIYGIEDQSLYLAQLSTYKDWRRLQEQALVYCQNLRDCLNGLKAHIFNLELKELDARITAYEEGEISFVEYAQYLNGKLTKGVQTLACPNFNRLVKAIEIEAEIDLGKVEGEKSALIDDLSERITAEAWEELTGQDTSYRLGNTGASKYYRFLRELAQKKGIEWEGFDNLATYLEYITLYEGIDNNLLFDEIDKVEERIREALYTDEAQRRLSHLSHNLSILKRLYSNALTPKEWRYYRSHKEEFSSGYFIDFIKEQKARTPTSTLALPHQGGGKFLEELPHQGGGNLLEVGRIDALIPYAERFYQVALDREEAMLRNTLAQMERVGVEMAVLVAGGFHTPSFMEMLRSKGISYVVVAPRLTAEAFDNTPYWDRLAGKLSDFEATLLAAISDARTESAVKHATGIGELTPEQRDGLQRAYHTMVKGCFMIGANITLSPSEMTEFIQRHLFDAFNEAEKEKTGIQLKASALPGGVVGNSYYINYVLDVPVGEKVRSVDLVAAYLAEGMQGLLSVDMGTLMDKAEEYQLIGHDKDTRGGYVLLARERFDSIAVSTTKIIPLLADLDALLRANRDIPEGLLTRGNIHFPREYLLREGDTTHLLLALTGEEGRRQEYGIRIFDKAEADRLPTVPKEEMQLLLDMPDERGQFTRVAQFMNPAAFHRILAQRVGTGEEASFYSLGTPVSEEVPRSEEMESLVAQLRANPDMEMSAERLQALGEYLCRRSQSRDEATRKATCENARRIIGTEIPALGFERDDLRGYSPVVNIFDVSPRGEAVAIAGLLPKTENVYNFVVVDAVKAPVAFGEGISGVIAKERIEAKCVQMFGRYAKDAAERLEAIIEVVKTEELPRLREDLEMVEVHYSAMVSVEQQRVEALNSLSALQAEMENLMIVACVEPAEGQRLPLPEIQYGFVQQEASGRVLKGKSKAEDLARRLRRSRLEQLYEGQFDNLIVVAPLNIGERMQQLYNSYVATAEAV